jgi:DNA-directed RNA polymerase specialized sigma24 family protein
LRRDAGLDRPENAGNLAELRVQLRLSLQETRDLLAWASGERDGEKLEGRAGVVAKVVNGLPREQRLVVVGHYFRQRSGKELAAATGLAPTLVSRRRMVGVRTLQRQLGIAGYIEPTIAGKWAAALLSTPVEARLLLAQPIRLIAASATAAGLSGADHDGLAVVAAMLDERDRRVLLLAYEQGIGDATLAGMVGADRTTVRRWRREAIQAAGRGWDMYRSTVHAVEPPTNRGVATEVTTIASKARGELPVGGVAGISLRGPSTYEETNSRTIAPRARKGRSDGVGDLAGCGAAEEIEDCWPSGVALRGEAPNHLELRSAEDRRW